MNPLLQRAKLPKRTVTPLSKITNKLTHKNDSKDKTHVIFKHQLDELTCSPLNLTSLIQGKNSNAYEASHVVSLTVLFAMGPKRA